MPSQLHAVGFVEEGERISHISDRIVEHRRLQIRLSRVLFQQEHGFHCR